MLLIVRVHPKIEPSLKIIYIPVQDLYSTVFVLFCVFPDRRSFVRHTITAYYLRFVLYFQWQWNHVLLLVFEVQCIRPVGFNFKQTEYFPLLRESGKHGGIREFPGKFGRVGREII